MAVIIIDGFDKYGPPSVTATRLHTLMTGEWSTTTLVPAIVAGLSSTGYAVYLSNNTPSPMTRSMGGSKSRVVGGFRFAIAVGTCGVSFVDSLTTQVSIAISAFDGAITARRGGMGGTSLGVASATVAADATHYLEYDITFHNTAGIFKIWLDGVLVLNLTGINTRSSANNSANIFQLIASSSSNITIDDLYLFDTSGSFNNAVLLTNPVVETQFPEADDSVDFTMQAGFIGWSESLANVSSSPGANTLFLRKISPTENMTLDSVSAMPAATSSTAKYKAVLYDDTAGAPDNLIDTGAEVVGVTVNTTFTSAFASGNALTAGTDYWIGFIANTSVSLHQYDAGTLGYKATNTYGSGAPATAPAMTSGQGSWQLWGNVTAVAVNYLEVNNNPPGLADLSYVSSDNPGDEDLYQFPALSLSPSNVYAVSVKAWARNSDAGVRTVQLHAKSGGTDGTGSAAAQGAGTTYGWLTSYFPTDPDTGAAWSGAAVNAATYGISIVT